MKKIDKNDVKQMIYEGENNINKLFQKTIHKTSIKKCMIGWDTKKVLYFKFRQL